MTTTITSLTVDSNPGSFWVGTIVTTLTSISISATATDGIVTDTSSPPKRTTMTPTTTASTAAASATPTSSSSGPSTGQLVGIIVGSVAGGLLLIALIFWFCWRRKRKIAARRRTKARINSPRRLTGQNFPIPASHILPIPTNTDQQVAWPRSVNPDDIGVAISPAGNQNFIRRLTQPRPGTNTFQPILEDRVSRLSTFRDRFFSNAHSSTRTQAPGTKHSSDATTIRTSCTLPTPDRPSIAVLRPWSTATSANTAFEEDMEFQPEEIPPLPTFTAVEVPLAAMNSGRKHAKPARLDLEAGIRKNYSKAASHAPMTPRYDNGYNESQRRPSGPAVPTSKLRSTKIMDRPRPNAATPTCASKPHGAITPMEQFSVAPLRIAPRTQIPNVPERDSSFRHFRDNRDDEQLLKYNNNITPQSRSTAASRPSLSAKRSNENSTRSSIRNLTYPKVPLSASDTRLDNAKASLQSLGKQRATQASATSSADDIAKYSNRPLPQIVKPDLDDPFEGPSNTARLFHTPLRLHVPPPPGPGRPNQSSRPTGSSRATFTPNRTNTGDLVLTVDM